MKRFLPLVWVLLFACGWGNGGAYAQCSSDDLMVNDTLTLSFEEAASPATLLVEAKGVQAVKLLVYSHKGSKVFESSSSILGASPTVYKTIDTGWDGTKMGRMLQAGLYVYMIEAECIDQTTVHKSGMITLVRTAPKRTQ